MMEHRLKATSRADVGTPGIYFVSIAAVRCLKVSSHTDAYKRERNATLGCPDPNLLFFLRFLSPVTFSSLVTSVTVGLG